MKIVIASGKNEADFLIKLFRDGRHKLIVINESREYSNYLSLNNDISVFFGDSTKRYILEEADVKQADVLIALSDRDSDNLVICQTAKKVFNVKKTVCIVANPKNVDIFKRLGINSVISSTYLVAQTIMRESTIENLINFLSIENDEIIITEIEIEKEYNIVHKMLKDIPLPKGVNISCIIRTPHAIIPNGSTIIEPNDRLVIVSIEKNQEPLLRIIQEKKKNAKR